MNNWVKMTNDEMEVGIEIATLKKGELQIKYAKDIVAKNKEIERLYSIIKEAREKVNNFDVFEEFTFPLMKRDVENQVKSSIDYEWRKSIKEPILEILDKVDKDV